MKVAMLMHVYKTLKHVKAPISNFRFRERFHSVFHKLVKTAFLEKEEEYNDILCKYK
ncbi:hypothetical protein HanRHA438_Chr07g0297011 [Helianthus annuus]|nr:hypothetical protein HanRHA438_Chr07g0297011 [Helianthus annuus]